jgi:toluene monooxygenase electron transfer component
MTAGVGSGSPAHRIQLDDGTHFDCGAGEDTLLRGALRAGVPWPYECSVGGCGACRFEVLEGLVQTLWDAAPGLSARDRARGKHLACQSRPLGDSRLKVRLEAAAGAGPAPRRRPAVLRARRPVTPDMDELAFERAPGDNGFLPGQYALLYAPGVAGARAYSMANLPGEAGGLWRFIVRRVPGGAGSAALAALGVGESIDIDGPFGHGHLHAGARDVVCVAGGSGLGPMLSVARGVLAQADDRTVHFFLGLRQQVELGALRELDGLDPARLRVHTVLSAPTSEPPWEGATGFVHAEVERVLTAPLDRHDFYFAGPPPMIEAVQALLMQRHRVPFAQIHFDRFV